MVTAMENMVSDGELRLIDAYRRACNYLSAGMIYLKDNPLLKEALKREHVKHRLLGYWGTRPGLSFVWVHLSRVIVMKDAIVDNLNYAHEEGTDRAEIANWTWPY